MTAGFWLNAGLAGRSGLAAAAVETPDQLRPAVDQAGGAVRVELDHPVPHDLQRDAADPGGFAAGRAAVKSGRSGMGMANLPRSPS
jgi:hypothetical protein